MAVVCAVGGWAPAAGAGPQVGDDERSAPRFGLRAAADVGVDFVHRSGAAGTAKRFMVECVGTGVGLIDVDDDGDLDLYLVQGGALDASGRPLIDASSRDALYLNDGAGHFSPGPADGELAAGFGFGVAAADVDGDDDLDLFVSHLGPNDLLLNDGKGRFTRAPDAGGLIGGPDDWTMGAAFADVDGDGDLDVAVTNYLAHDLEHPMLSSSRPCRWVGCDVPCGPRGLTPQVDRLYLNDGAGRFLDVSEGAGLREAPAGFSFQPVFGDFDADGDPDLFVAVDSVPNQLWRNDGPGDDGLVHFTEVGLMAGVALSDTGKEQAGMGVAVGDVDGDGRQDLVLTNFSQEQNALFHNESGERQGLLFFDESGTTGIGWPSYFDLGWGASLFDVELDGDLDLFVANGHVYPHVDDCEITKTTFAQCNRLLVQDAPGRFSDGTEAAGPGLAEQLSSRGSAAGDLDGDGDMDLVVVHLDAAPSFLINTSEAAGTALLLDLRPRAAAIGARVEITCGERVVVAEVRAGSSFLCAEDARVHVGVPAGDEEHEGPTAVVRWRDGRVDRVELPRSGIVPIVRGDL